MKLKGTLAAFALIGCGIGFSSLAFAQACTANGQTFSGATIPPSAVVNANTCGSNPAMAAICQNANGLNGAGLDIYQVTLGATNGFSFSVNTAAFTPEIALISGSCTSNAACIVDQTIPAAGNVSSGAIPQQAAGTYFLFVGDTAADAPGCGAYTLTVNPTLPVQLQNFSVG